MSSEAEGIRVLHVDDESDFSEIVAMHLERVDERLTVLTEADPRRALDRLDSNSIDCVVSDHDMPEMNGLELLKTVREEYPDLPFILFTGKGSEEIASDAISAGVTEYLQKGTGAEQYTVLANRIERAVEANRAKTALEESERQLSTLISNLPGIVYRSRDEPGWPKTFVSDGAKELTGYDSSSIEDGDVAWSDLIADEELDRVRESVQACIAGDDPFEVTYPIETRSGDRRWVWERGQKVGEAASGVAILEGFIIDITVRKKRETELEREREFTENLINAIDDVFCLLGPDGTLLRWNDTVNEVTGYTNDELMSMNALEIIDDDFRATAIREGKRALETGQANLEAPIVTKDGEQLRFEFRGSRIRHAAGELVGIAGIGREISERKEQEQTLEQYKTLVENVGGSMFVLDENGVIQMANRAMAEFLSVDRSDLVGTESSSYIVEEDLAKGQELIADLLDSPEKKWGSVEMTVVDSNGDTIETETNLAILTEDGEFAGSVGIISPIHERKERKRELERYETIIEAVGDPVYTLDTDGTFTYVNEAIEEMTGYRQDELVGEHIEIIMTDADVERGNQLIRDLLETEDRHATMEMDVVTRDGDHIPCENNMAVLPEHGDEFGGTAGVIRDIATRKERERRLAEFASVVSHDLRSPLNVVQGRIEMARESGTVTHLDEAAASATRMEEMIDNLLTLAKQGQTVSEINPVDVGVAVEQAWKVIDDSDATVVVEDAPVVDADAARLRELLENLFRNSVEHAGDDVTVTIGRLNSDPDEDDLAGFYVADDGPGIPAAKQDEVFERGHTTSSNGTGFGLAIVEDIVTAHGWTVELTDSNGGGARFEFRTNPAAQ